MSPSSINSIGIELLGEWFYEISLPHTAAQPCRNFTGLPLVYALNPSFNSLSHKLYNNIPPIINIHCFTNSLCVDFHRNFIYKIMTEVLNLVFNFPLIYIKIHIFLKKVFICVDICRRIMINFTHSVC
jgi:hypothetical protein